MMINRKTIGILSSIVLILGYIVTAAVDIISPGNINYYELNATLGQLIHTLGMIGLYYALILCLKPKIFRSEVMWLNICIMLVFVTFILHIVQFYHGIVPPLLMSLLYISGLLAFIVFGINTLRHSNEEYGNLSRLKTFIISMFIIIGIMLVKTALLAVYHRIEYTSFAYFIYAIPYIFVLRFFLNENVQDLTYE